MAPDPNDPPPVSLSSIDVHHVRWDTVAIDAHGPEHAPSHIIRIGDLGRGVVLHIEAITTVGKLDMIEAIGEKLAADARRTRRALGLAPEAVAS